MRADDAPSDPSYPASPTAIFTTFVCAACDCILGISWAPPALAHRLRKLGTN
jgi:hypothetical protein